MRRVVFHLPLLLALACAPKTPAAEGDESGDPLGEVGDPGAHTLQWRDDEDRISTSPVSLTASDGTGLQLVSMEARAVLEDPLAFTELTMTFRNPEDRIREGRFEINLPPGAAISRFAMKIDGKWQEAEVVERQAARRAYEDFLHRKQDPALLEKKAGNQFRARVFPIPAKGVKELKVSYSQEIRNSKEPYRIMLKGLPRMSSLDVDVAVVRSAASGMSSTMGGKSSAVEHLTIREEDAAPRSDLEVHVERPIARRGLRHENLALARIAPVLDEGVHEIEGLTILFDTSASRALGFDNQLERLGELVGSLAARGDFELQVLAFDQTTEEVYFGSAKGFGRKSLDALAKRHALGASNLEAAVRSLHTAPNVQSRVLLLSDGINTAGVRDHDALREAVVGLQAREVDRFDALVDGGIQDEATLAALTTAGLEHDGVVASARMTRDTLVHKLTHATRSNVKVNVPGANWVWPRQLDGVQAGDEFLIYADLPADQPMVVELEADTKQEIRVPLRAAEGKLLERAWTQASLARMSAQVEAMDVEQEAEARAKLQADIVDLSVKKRVLSDYTALLVLETDADYQRFDIDRRSLADILTVGPAGIEVLRRSEPESEEEEPPPEDSDDEAGGQGQRHKGEEGKMGKPTSKNKSGLYSMRGPRDAIPQMARNFDPEPEEANAAFAVGNDDEDVWGGLEGSEVGESFGVGGLGLVGTGRGGGGTGEGTIGLAEEAPMGLIGAGGGSGSGYGRGSGAGFGGRGRRVPRVRQGRATVQGSLDRDIVRRIVRAHINELRHCYNQELTRDPNLNGNIELEFTIDPAGSVSKSSVAEGGLDNENLRSCASRAVRRWRFPKPRGGGSVNVRYPIMFSPGDGVSSGGFHSSPESPKKQDAWTGTYAEIMELIDKGELELALTTAWQWRENEPGSELALLGLGDAAEANEDWELAARAYGSLIDLFPSRADIRRMAGGRLERVAIHEGELGLELAIDTFAQAVEQRPDHPSSHRMYAFALLKAERHQDALDAIVAGLEHDYPGGRFRGVEQILREDAGLIAAAWLAVDPKAETRIQERLGKVRAKLANEASTRFVLNWETDANDVDFHIFDANGGHASYRNMQLASGGRLYADVTTGYGPECFTIEGKPDAYPYTLQGHYYSMGPMGYGMGKLQTIEHDGKGNLRFDEQPFVIMKDQAYVNLGKVERPLAQR